MWVYSEPGIELFVVGCPPHRTVNGTPLKFPSAVEAAESHAHDAVFAQLSDRTTVPKITMSLSSPAPVATQRHGIRGSKVWVFRI